MDQPQSHQNRRFRMFSHYFELECVEFCIQIGLSRYFTVRFRRDQLFWIRIAILYSRKKSLEICMAQPRRNPDFQCSRIISSSNALKFDLQTRLSRWFVNPNPARPDFLDPPLNFG